MKILTLDLATRTGFALWNGSSRESGFVVFDVKRGESPGMRFVRFTIWIDEMVKSLVNTEGALVFYEQPFVMRSGAAAEISLGFATRVQEACARHGVNHQPVNGSTLKKWTTGKGNAKKPAMIAAVNERFGPPFVTDDNEADAIALLEYAREWLVGATA